MKSFVTSEPLASSSIKVFGLYNGVLINDVDGDPKDIIVFLSTLFNDGEFKKLDIKSFILKLLSKLLNSF